VSVDEPGGCATLQDCGDFVGTLDGNEGIWWNYRFMEERSNLLQDKN
jgi:hypothetical protein